MMHLLFCTATTFQSSHEFRPKIDYRRTTHVKILISTRLPLTTYNERSMKSYSQNPWSHNFSFVWQQPETETISCNEILTISSLRLSAPAGRANSYFAILWISLDNTISIHPIILTDREDRWERCCFTCSYPQILHLVLQELQSDYC